MWAIICRSWGEPEDLDFDEMPEPDMIEGGVRIKVRAAGVNFADSLIIAGKYQVKPFHPFSPGLEVAGEVMECAPSVVRFKPGDRVMALVQYGGYAEQVVTEESDVFLIPDNMDFITAASFLVVYGTSHIGIKYKLNLKKGETLLINGAAGGVGLTAIEIAKLMGGTIIAAAGSKNKLELAKKMGAHHLINYREEDVRARVKIFTKGKGVDAVYDPVGGDAFEVALRATSQRGRVLVVGFASGSVQKILANILLVKNISVIGYYWGAYRILEPKLLKESFAELIGWFEEGKLRPHISQTFDLPDAGAAIKALSSRQSTGKVVIKI
jgi:NADPH2:quinone reductase